MDYPFRVAPSDRIELYGHDGQMLGILHQTINTAAGERCYGVLAFTCGDGRVFQVPVPWEIIKHNDRTNRYVADVDRLKLMEVPHLGDAAIAGFDADFASIIDVAYGLEFPGIESMNDLA
jgi:hypothetical protein